MKNIKLLFIVIAAMLISLIAGVAAQEDTEMTQELPAANEKMQDMAWFIGEWDVQSRMLVDAENDDWLEETLHTVHTYEMGGHIIFEHFFGPLGGEPFEAWSIRKYNANTEKWQQRWMDTSTPFIMNWVGSMTEDGEFVGYNEFFLDAEGNLAGERGARETFYNITEDSFSWRYESTQDGGETWTTIWTLEYTRKDG